MKAKQKYACFKNVKYPKCCEKPKKVDGKCRNEHENEKKKYEKFIGQLPSLYDFLWY